MKTIRDHTGKLLAFSRSANCATPNRDSVYDASGSFLGTADDKATRDASGAVVTLGRAPAQLLRR